MLINRVDEMRENNRDLVDIAAQEFFNAEPTNCLGLDKSGRILQFKIRQQLPTPACNKLPRLPTGSSIDCFIGFETQGLAHQVGVERTGKSLVGADDEN